MLMMQSNGVKLQDEAQIIFNAQLHTSTQRCLKFQEIDNDIVGLNSHFAHINFR